MTAGPTEEAPWEQSGGPADAVAARTIPTRTASSARLTILVDDVLILRSLLSATPFLCAQMLVLLQS